VCCTLQLAAVQIPAIGGFVDVVPLGWEHWVLAAVTASSLLVVDEVRKALPWPVRQSLHAGRPGDH
jgi:hypothetical protein